MDHGVSALEDPPAVRPPLEVLLYFLGHEGRDEILRHYRRDSCLASTRIGIEFLRHFGYTARPLRTSSKDRVGTATSSLRSRAT